MTAALPFNLELTRQSQSLFDLMADGFYLLFLLRSGHAPDTDATGFTQSIERFLHEFERNAKCLHASPDDIFAVKYAFCAALDETILSAQFSIRDEWEREPLQIKFFGEQLAGNNFFTKLEKMQQQGASRLQTLEVFHMCLLLGFQGKYRLEGSEQLSYLKIRLGEEITRLKGKRAFAPNWKLPDKIAHSLKTRLPIWLIGAAFCLLGLMAYIGLEISLSQEISTHLANFTGVIKLALPAAHLTITLP